MKLSKMARIRLIVIATGLLAFALAFIPSTFPEVFYWTCYGGPDCLHWQDSELYRENHEIHTHYTRQHWLFIATGWVLLTVSAIEIFLIASEEGK